MEATKKIVLFMALLMWAIVMVADADSGSATPNIINYPSACYGYDPLPEYSAGVSEDLWNNGEACGSQYTVTCTGATNEGVPQPCTGESVTVTVVDHCPSPGCQAPFDLCEAAFEVIADPAAGRVLADYQLISAGTGLPSN